MTYLQVHSWFVCSLNKYPKKDPYYPLYLMPLSIWAPEMSSHLPHSSNLCPPDHTPPALEDLAQAPTPAWSLLLCPHPPMYYTCTECCFHFIRALILLCYKLHIYKSLPPTRQRAKPLPEGRLCLIHLSILVPGLSLARSVKVILLLFPINFIWIPNLKSHWLISTISICSYSGCHSFIFLFLSLSHFLYSYNKHTQTIYMHACMRIYIF